MSDSPPPMDTGYVEPSVGRISVRTAAVLLAFTLVFTALMAGTYKLTEPLVMESARVEKLRLIGEVLPIDAYDNNLLADSVLIPAQSELDTREDTLLFRARKGSVPVASVIEAAAPDGYSGRIELLLAVSAEGQLLALRVTGHKETPGLGDYIDPKKDRNKQRPWITQFNRIGFEAVPEDRWRVKKDGGYFDQMNGATISARAVTNASRRAMAWIIPRQAALFSLPAGARFEAEVNGGKSP